MNEFEPSLTPGRRSGRVVPDPSRSYILNAWRVSGPPLHQEKNRAAMSDPTLSSHRISQYTSIIYFHGMGIPRRYEEVSRVLDSMDRYASEDAVGKVGMLRGQKVGLELRRDNPRGRPVTYFKFTRFIPKVGKSAQLVGVFRLYENFWSPAAAGGVSFWGVLIWLIRRTLHPLFVITMPWRAYQRLKRTYLNKLFYDRKDRPAVFYRDLSRSYRDFEGMEARRLYPRGRFTDFVAYLEAKFGCDTKRHAELLALANEWRHELTRAQAALIFLAATAYAGALGIATGLVFLVASLLSWLGTQWPWVMALVGRAGPIAPPITLMLAAAMALLAAGVVRFSTRFLSDVVFWTTTLEKDLRYQKRQEILNAAEDMVLHIITDPHCERIVIMGHSLGTAIAHETLLNLGKRLKAERDTAPDNPSPYEALRKISHFISLGSPIDRINYFFNLTFSRYHRFNRVADELMGQASDLPYKDGREPIIRWVNIRDRADPIASRLFSARGPLPNRDDIHEVEVASSHFPNPGGAHTGYFQSWLAAKVIYDMAVLGRETLQLASSRPRWSYRAASVLRWTAWVFAAMFTWAIGLGGVGFIIGSNTLMHAAQIASVAMTGGVFTCWVIGQALDRRYPLILKS